MRDCRGMLNSILSATRTLVVYPVLLPRVCHPACRSISRHHHRAFGMTSSGRANHVTESWSSASARCRKLHTDLHAHQFPVPAGGCCSPFGPHGTFLWGSGTPRRSSCAKRSPPLGRSHWPCLCSLGVTELQQPLTQDLTPRSPLHCVHASPPTASTSTLRFPCSSAPASCACCGLCMGAACCAPLAITFPPPVVGWPIFLCRCLFYHLGLPFPFPFPRPWPPSPDGCLSV